MKSGKQKPDRPDKTQRPIDTLDSTRKERLRRRAGQQLRQRQQFMQRIADTVPYLLYVFDLREKRTIYVNPQTEVFFGHSFAELQAPGQPFPFDAVHPDDLNKLQELKIQWDLAADGQVFEKEYRLRNAAGQYRWIRSQESILERGPDGAPIRILGTAQDVTERKQSEINVQESEERYHQLFNASFDVLIVIDPEGHILDANQAAITRYGYSYSELLQTTVFELSVPGLREHVRQRLQTTLARGGQFEWRHQRRDGSELPVEIAATPINFRGKPAILSAIRDITERKQVEEALLASQRKFKALYDIAPVGISLLDHDRKIMEANATLEKITRVTMQGLLVGNYRMRQYLRHDGTPMPPDEFASVRAVNEKRPVYNIQTGIVTEEGETIWTEVSAAPLDLPDASVVIVTNDITERKQAEEQLRSSRDRLSELSRRLADLHETESRAIGRELHDQIGQMLTALKLTLSIIPELPPEVAAQKLTKSQELVDELLTRVSALSLELRSPMLDDLGLLPALLWHVNDFQEDSRITVDFKHNGIEGRRFLRQTESTAYRLIQESLTNVARHSHGTHVCIEICVGDEQMEIEIADNGQGFNPRIALGLHRGLRGMRERVELVGGSFQIESQPGRGARLLIQLPALEKNP